MAELWFCIMSPFVSLVGKRKPIQPKNARQRTKIFWLFFTCFFDSYPPDAKMLVVDEKLN